MNSKIISLVSLIAIIGCFIIPTNAIMEDKILEVLEEIRNRMCHPLFGLPALDPFQMEHANFSMNNEYVVDFACSVTKFHLTGLSNFNVTSLKISTIPLRRSNFNVVLPSTAVKSLYTAHGSLAHIVYFNGNDKAEAQIEEAQLSTSWNLKTGLTIGIKNLKVEISIGKLFVDIENLMEEPRLNDFVYALINEMGIELLNDLWLEAQDKGVTKYIENILNKILGNYTISDILKVISSLSGGDGPPFGGVPADCKTGQVNSS